MTNTSYKKLGIIGGLGPAATAQLLARITYFTIATCDQDHLDVTILSRPQIPDRTSFLLKKKNAQSFIEPMQQAAKQLEDLGCEILAIPCNTAHAGIEQIKKAVSSAQFVNMIDQTIKTASTLGCKNVGFLATQGTRDTGIYSQAAHAQHMCATWPDEVGQKQVSDTIYKKIKAGKPICGHELDGVFDVLIEQGCDGLVLGCTELSVLGCPTNYGGVPVIDALDVLAHACVCACGAPAHELFEQSQ